MANPSTLAAAEDFPHPVVNSILAGDVANNIDQLKAEARDEMIEALKSKIAAQADRIQELERTVEVLNRRTGILQQQRNEALQNYVHALDHIVLATTGG